MVTTTPKQKKKPRMIACRYCGAQTDAASASTWAHSHPAVCPFRTDRVPVMNGVHVGDHWRNRHTGGISRVVECRLGGAGTYLDREPCFVTADVWQPPKQTEREGEQLTLDAATPEPTGYSALEIAESAFVWEHPMWSLVEHYDPVDRPGEYPVPFETRTDRGYEERWALDAWRCAGYRHAEEPEQDRDKAYWHPVHVVYGHAIRWGDLNALWQINVP